MTINEQLKELFKDTSFENYQYEDFSTADELMEAMQEEISQDEVIYFSNAMEYLMENDSSLMESCELASDLGYETKNLNSELLATILTQHNLNQELYKLQDEIEEIYNSESEE